MPVTSTPATMKKSGSASGQKSIQSFFSKTPTTSNSVKLPERSSPRKTVAGKPNFNKKLSRSDLTPVPSSDAPVPEDADEPKASPTLANGLPSPVSADKRQTQDPEPSNEAGTPSRRVRNSVALLRPYSDAFRPKTRKSTTSNPIVKERIMKKSFGQRQHVENQRKGEESQRAQTKTLTSKRMMLKMVRDTTSVPSSTSLTFPRSRGFHCPR